MLSRKRSENVDVISPLIVRYREDTQQVERVFKGHLVEARDEPITKEAGQSEEM